MISLWSDTSNLPHFKQLDKDINVDVLIVGGGLSGILCAYMLHQSGISYALVEAKEICSGITKNTTAKITSQHGFLYDSLIHRFGDEKARLYLEINNKAIERYREMCKKVNCDFEEKDNFVFSFNKHKIEKELAAINSLGFDTEYVDNIAPPIPVVGAIKFKNQAQFHPLKFVASIAEKLNIYEHTKVQELIDTSAITAHAKINAKKIIIATHFPIINKHGFFFLKLYQHRSYVIALENAPNFNGMFVDESKKGLSFRNAGNLLLLGGGDHRTGKQGGNWQELELFTEKHFPNAKIKYRWATQDCMSLDDVPYIGQYSPSTPNLYVATGFNKWGMSTAMVSAMILSDLVQEKENPYAKVFSPDRTILRPQLAINALESTINLLTPTKKRCPHLGCALKWNPAERSWDCPCHGSRFEENGNLIDNPATGDL